MNLHRPGFLGSQSPLNLGWVTVSKFEDILQYPLLSLFLRLLDMQQRLNHVCVEHLGFLAISHLLPIHNKTLVGLHLQYSFVYRPKFLLHELFEESRVHRSVRICHVFLLQIDLWHEVVIKVCNILITKGVFTVKFVGVGLGNHRLRSNDRWSLELYMCIHFPLVERCYRYIFDLSWFPQLFSRAKLPQNLCPECLLLANRHILPSFLDSLPINLNQLSILLRLLNLFLLDCILGKLLLILIGLPNLFVLQVLNSLQFLLLNDA